MSLKAKIEAVIYASEEPVTLAQLVGLLGEEAQSELDREAASQLVLLNEAEPEADPTPGQEAVTKEVPTEVEPAVEAAQAADGEETATRVAPAEAEPTKDQEAATNAAAAKAEKARAAKLRAYFRGVLDQLVAEYAAPESDRGLEIREVAGGFRFGTKPEYHDAVRGFVKSLKPPLKLSLQALETLAVIAYKQPVTAPEISEIRGVDSGGVLGSLLARKLITTAGRKHVIGRPILYKTTKEFLLKFGLKDVAELPSIEEFEKMAGQLAEQEEIPMEDVSGPHDAPENAAELEEQRESHEPQADGDSEPAGEDSGQTETPQSIEDRLESDQEAPAPEPLAEEVIVDGRESGLPPRYDDSDDPSAQEAEIQRGEVTS